jgi:probable HAF family extracellular repeat protein
MPETTMRRTTITALALLALAVSVAGVARPARADIVYTLKDLGTLGGTSSYGFGVNDAGQVVGSLYNSLTGGGHAVLYSGGQMLDLNSLIAPGSGFTLTAASGISDTGYITGVAVTSQDLFEHAFLLTPVPEPCGLVLLGTGAVGLLGYTVRRRARPRAGRRG